MLLLCLLSGQGHKSLVSSDFWRIFMLLLQEWIYLRLLNPEKVEALKNYVSWIQH